jgi:hypothetical protein
MRADGTGERDQAAEAAAGPDRARDLVDATAAADLTIPFAPDGDPVEGVHMLVLEEVLYAAERGLIDPSEVRDLLAAAPADLEVVLTGGHERPDYPADHGDLVTNVRKETHPIDAGQGGATGNGVLRCSGRKPPADGRLTPDGPGHKTLTGPPPRAARRMGGTRSFPAAPFPTLTRTGRCRT